MLIAARCVDIDLGHGRRYVVLHLSSSEDLEPFVEYWTRLSEQGTDPNVYYAPWFFLPAAKNLSKKPDWQILLVWRIERTLGNVPVLCGFFPFVQQYRRQTGRVWSLWAHDYCFLSNPLIEDGREADVWESVLKYARQAEPRVSAIDCPLLSGEGLIHQGLLKTVRNNLSTTYQADHYLRATTPYLSDTEELLKQSVAGHHLREFKRLRRKLEGEGQLEYRSLTTTKGVDLWIDWFLELEAAGWKAQAGTAIRQKEADSRFFQEMVRAGLEQERLVMEGLFLNGKPIAMKVNLLAPPAAFAFKIAFDESLGKFSPGIQLELDSLQQFGNHETIKWADSCAAPGHPMIDRIWSERRVIQHLVIATGRGASDLIWGIRPFLRACRRMQKRWINQSKDYWKRFRSKNASPPLEVELTPKQTQKQPISHQEPT